MVKNALDRPVLHVLARAHLSVRSHAATSSKVIVRPAASLIPGIFSQVLKVAAQSDQMVYFY